MLISHKSIDDTKIQQKIEEESKKSPVLNNVIKSCVEKSDNQSFSTADCIGSEAFKSGDLYYSIHKFKYDISGERIDDIYWNIDVRLYETYDFTEWWREFSTGALANNLGYEMQKYGLLEPYEWEVNYTRIYTNY